MTNSSAPESPDMPDGLHHNKPAPVPGVVLRDGQPTQSDMRFLKLWPKPESRCLSLEDVADAAGVKQITAAKALSQLRKKGLIQKMGFKMRERGAVRAKWQSTTLGDAAVEEYLLRESEVIVLESKAQGGFVELPDGSSAWSEARTWGIIATSKSKLQDGTKLYPTPQPAPVQQRKPLDLAAAIEYADARWAGVDVPVEWCRHFADALQPAQPARAFVRLTNAQWQDILDDNRLDNIGAIKTAIEAKLKENNT